MASKHEKNNLQQGKEKNMKERCCIYMSVGLDWKEFKIIKSFNVGEAAVK